jgi:hypothetical protein
MTTGARKKPTIQMIAGSASKRLRRFCRASTPAVMPTSSLYGQRNGFEKSDLPSGINHTR